MRQEHDGTLRHRVAWESVSRRLMTLFVCLGAAIFAPQALSAPASFALEVREVGGAPLGTTVGTSAEFEYLVNEDNSGQPSPLVDPDLHPGQSPMASYSPIVDMGRGTAPATVTITLEGTSGEPEAGRYLVTVRAEGYKMWGQLVTLVSDTDPGTVVVELIPHPLPLATLQVSIFPDTRSVNAAPDIPEEESQSMAGFQIVLEDRVGQVVVDYYNNPICTVYDGDPSGEFPPGNIVSSPGCLTNAAGEVTIENLPPGGYSTFAIPPDGSGWIQTTTFEGKHDIDFTNLTEGDDGFGAIGESRLGPLTLPTAFWFGFVKRCTFGNVNDSCPTNNAAGTATVTGRARTLVKFPPGATNGALSEPVVRPWIALSANGGGGEQVYTARGNANGTFTIPNVPAGEYMLTIWDNPLDYIMRFAVFTVDEGETLDLGDLGVFRWFGWVSGDVFEDSGLDGLGLSIPTSIPGPDPANPAAENGVRDCDPALPARCEVGIPTSDLDIRFRDGSVKSATFTNPSGHYEFAEEFSKLFRFNILEVGFGRYARTGHSVHNALKLNNPDGDHDDDGTPNFMDGDLAGVTVVPQDLGGGLLLNQKTDESHRSEVDFGKLEYPADDRATVYDPDDISTWGANYEGGNGGITGIAFNAITRNELEARLQANEDYEAGIPDVLLRLWGLGADGEPNTPDDVLLNELNADTWSHPRADHPDLPQECDIRDQNGDLVPDPTLAPGSDILDGDPTLGASKRCMELALLGNETKAGAFDGGYAFEEACVTGMLAGGNADGDGISNEDETDPLLPDGPPDPDACASPLVPQDYVVQAVTPDFMQVVREEDVNVNDGDQLVPAIPPAECVGDLHTVDVLGVGLDGDDAVYNPTFAEGTLYTPAGGSPYEGQDMPFCDKRLVVMEDQGNPAADFFFFPNFVPEGALEREAVEVPTAGRIFGLVTDDTHFESDPRGVLFGEPRPLPNIPIGIRDYTGRLITTVLTDENGFYETILPSTYTANCPNPGGYCPGMYVFVIDDPGDPVVVGGAPNDPPGNPTYNPNYLIEPLAFDVWPGKTTLLDTPLDAIAGVTCDPSGTAGNPDQTDGLFTPLPEFFSVSQPYGSAGDAITIKGDFFGATQGSGTVTLDGVPQTIVPSPADPPNYPADADGWAANRITFEITGPPGPHQLLVTNDDGNTIYNGITIHVLGGGYNPPVVTVSPDAAVGATPIQDAIDGAAAGSLIVVEPGTYRENVILHKRVKLQGYGPGGQAGTRFVLSPPDDIRRLVEGTSIDGRFFRFPANTIAWQATLAGPASPYSEPAASTGVPQGAGITVVAADGEFTSGFNAQIDGFHVTLGTGIGGAGGIQAHAYARFLEISNNILEGNGGEFGGGIGLGSPVVGDSQNDSVEIHNNRVMGSGGRRLAGGIGIFTGAANYAVRDNLLCANFATEYGGGISHFGRSPNGVIEDNNIYFNDAFDEGGGIFVGGEPPTSTDPLALSDGTGPVDIDRNHINSNVSNDDGGGIMVLDALEARINVRNNNVVNNVAGDFGAIVLDDSTNVSIVNNTIAHNVSTGTAEDRDTTCGLNAPFLSCPHGAGLVSHTNSDALNNELYGSTAPNCALVDCFSNPVLFNDIFYANEALTWNPLSTGDAGEPDEPPAAALETNGCMDLEIFGVTPTPDPTLQFSPTFSILSNVSEFAAAHPTNLIAPDEAELADGCPAVGTFAPLRAEFHALAQANFPQFRLISNPELSVGPVGGNPLELIVNMLKTDPRPLGHNGLPGDFHLLEGSPAINTGTASVGSTGAPFDDIDRELRPQDGAWEMGADETLGAPPLPPEPTEPPEVEPVGGAAVIAGALLTATTGGWLGTPPFTFAFQWQRLNGAAWVGIPGATGQNYRVRIADARRSLRVQVTASNVGGLYSAVQTSAPVRVQGPPTVRSASAAVRSHEATFRATTQNCSPCKVEVRFRYKGTWFLGAWHTYRMGLVWSSQTADARRWLKAVQDVSSGRWEYYVRITDLDTGRKTKSAARLVRVR